MTEPQQPRLAECGAPPPAPSGLVCWLTAGHEGPHRNSTDRTWGIPVVRRPVRMCVHCEALTDRPVVVSEVHQNSGPGFNVYACPDCAPLLPSAPDVLSRLPARPGGGEQ